MKLDGFGLFVKDMEKMVHFYREVLHFDIIWESSQNNVYLVKDGVLFLMYGRVDFEKMTRQNYLYSQGYNGTFEIALSVANYEEVDKEFTRIIAMGGKAVLNPETEPWGQRTCYVADPEGNLIEIGSFNKN
jgi:catechol 2,3-dioxygenase-like lactoylglutathione lyase family enzyme